MEKKDGIVYYCNFPVQLRTKETAAAREILKQGFSEFFQVNFQEGKVRRKENGKPYYEGYEHLHFNISHCAGGVAAALSHHPVGIDVESMRTVKKRTVKKCCCREEEKYIFKHSENRWDGDIILTDEETRRFLALWTLKESDVKMTGEGLRKPLHEVCFKCLDQETSWEQRVQTIKGIDSSRRHYLYSAGKLILALTVSWQNMPINPDFIWREIPFQSLTF